MLSFPLLVNSFSKSLASYCISIIYCNLNLTTGSCVEGSTIGCSIDQPLNTERVRGSRFLMNAVSKGIPVLESLKTTRSNHPSIEEEDGTEDMDAEEKTTATSCLPENNSESNIGKEGTTGGDETEDEESAIFV